MDDALAVGVLHGVANLREQLQALFDRETVLVTELRNRFSLDKIHHKIGAPGARGTSIEHARDVWMIHQR